MFRETEVKGVKSTNTNVTSMGYMFRDSRATELDLSSFDTSKVTNMSYMFYDSKATELDLSNFDTSNVTNMSYMFQNSQATELEESNFDTSKVTNMSYMFDGSQAMELDLSSFDTSKVTNMTGMFRDSKATIGYARTQGDADNFNESSDRPSTLFFNVKGLPKVTFTTNGNTTYQRSHSTRVDVEALVSKLTDLKYQWSTGISTPTSGTWVTFANGGTISKSTGTGDYYLHIRATSDVGITTDTVSKVFRFDNTIPTSPNIQANTAWSNKNETVTIVQGKDDHSGVDKTEYRLNNGTWQTYGSSFTISTNGETKIDARTIDKAGNVSNLATRTVKIDKELPTVKIVPSTTGQTHEDVTLTVEAEDIHSGVNRIQTPDGEWKTSPRITYSVKENGTYSFTVEDNAGNRRIQHCVVDNIDKTITFSDTVIEELETITIGKHEETIGTNISPIHIKDWRDGVNNWKVNVSADLMKLKGQDYVLPEGTIILNPASTIKRIEGSTTLPIKGFSSQTAIDGSSVTVVEAGNSRGEYEIVFPDNVLEIGIDPSIIKAGTYETTLTWELITAP